MKFHRDQQYEHELSFLGSGSYISYQHYVQTKDLNALAWHYAFQAMYQLRRNDLVDTKRFECYSRFRKLCNNTLEHIRELRIQTYINSLPIINRMNF